MAFQEERKVRFYPDTSENLHAYSVKDNGRWHMQTEKPIKHRFGYYDYLVKRHLHKDEPPSMHYRMGVTIGQNDFFYDNIENPGFQMIVDGLHTQASLTMTETKINLAYGGKDMLSIFNSRTPIVLFKPKNANQLVFDMEGGYFEYWLDVPSAISTVPSLRMRLIMSYDLDRLLDAKNMKLPFESDEYFQAVRPGINAFMAFDPI